MKTHLATAALLVMTTGALAGDRIYRCGDVFTQDVPPGNPQKCIAMVPKPAKNWTQVADSGDGGATYFDYSTRKRKGNIVKVWVLITFGPVDPGKAGSVKSLDEYDCSEEAQRSLYWVEYVDAIGEGAMRKTVEIPGRWTPVMPDSIGATNLKAACK